MAAKVDQTEPSETSQSAEDAKVKQKKQPETTENAEEVPRERLLLVQEGEHIAINFFKCTIYQENCVYVLITGLKA